jgi:hypothetical protein
MFARRILSLAPFAAAAAAVFTIAACADRSIAGPDPTSAAPPSLETTIATTDVCTLLDQYRQEGKISDDTYGAVCSSDLSGAGSTDVAPTQGENETACNQITRMYFYLFFTFGEERIPFEVVERVCGTF